MKLYKLSRTNSVGYDEYSDCIVVASSTKAARLIYPSTGEQYSAKRRWTGTEWQRYGYTGEWETDSHSEWQAADKLTVEYIGTAAKHLKSGTVICASYNAG